MLIEIAFLVTLCSLGLFYVCFKRERAPFQLQMALVEQTEAASNSKEDVLDVHEKNIQAASSAPVENRATVKYTETASTVTETLPLAVPYNRSASVGYLHEVFLSFCGGDTRTSFVDCLYEALVKAGIQTFRDDKNLPKGRKIEDLLEAIENSKIAIPILSRNYARREWCLRELVKIVECGQQKNQSILPIFYDVEPSVVRNQTGCYGSAFLEHQDNNIDKQTIDSWRHALTYVTTFSGWEVQKIYDGRQGELINTVISLVWKILGKSELCVPNDIKRESELEEKLVKLLDLDANDVRIVGICGKHGSGKTTLAKCIYNDIFRQFDKRCSFLSDVEEKLEKSGMMEILQKQLIDDLLQGNGPEKINNTDSGIHIISKRFRKMKVLLLLDDVGEKKHLDALAREPKWFGPGSRIIITTRNKDILNNNEIYGFIEMPNHRKSHSELLQKGLFGSSGHEASTDGVLNCLMQEYAEAETLTMKKCLLFSALYPNGSQFKREELIDLFIHAGLIKEDSREAELERGHNILDMLENADFLERVNTPFQESELKMIDPIRDMVLREKKFEVMVKAGSKIVEMPDKKEWETEKEGKNLELVSLMNTRIEEIVISPICPELSVLLLCSNPLRRISNCFFKKMPKLKVLNLSFTRIKELPKSVGNLVKLVELNLRCCHELEEIHSLAKLTELRKLDLYKTALKQEPDGLNELVKLRYLSLCYQERPSVFGPRNFGSYRVKEGSLSIILLRLSQLHHFEVYIANASSNCFQQWYKFFIAATSSSKASNFYLSVEDNVVSGSPIYARICRSGRYLNSIDIDVSPREKSTSTVFPGDKKVLHMLVRNRRNLWDSYQQMLQILRVFKVKDCKELEEIIGAGKIDGTSLNLTVLQELELKRLPRLQKISAQRRLICNFLERVNISDCPALVSLNLLPNLKNLQELTVRKCGQLARLIIEEDEKSPRVGDKSISISLPKLVSLKLDMLPKLKSISAKKMLICKALCNLEISSCETIVSLQILPKIKKLKTLIVRDCEQLEEIIVTEHSEESQGKVDENINTALSLPKLDNVYLENLPHLVRICERILVCNALSELEIRKCPKLKRIPFTVISGLQNLVELKVADCELVEEIISASPDEIQGLLRDADNDSELPLIKLRNLRLEKLANLKSILPKPLLCHSLETAEIIECPLLKRISLSQQLVSDRPSLPTLKNITIATVCKGLRLMNDDEVDQVFQKTKRWWESLEWDDPEDEKLLRRKVKIIGEESLNRKLKDEIRP